MLQGVQVTMYLQLLVLIMVCCTCTQGQEATKVLNRRGDVILGGLFPIHKKSTVTENACGDLNLQPGYQYMTAMLFALEQINNDSALLPNITIGTRVYDSCLSSTIGADRARDFIKETLLVNDAPLVGVVGPFASDVSIATAPLLRVFGIPQVSYGSTSSVLSNKQLYKNFFRTVPSDLFLAKAMVDIMRHFGWKYIVTVNSKGNYGEKGIKHVQSAAEHHGICIATSHTLPHLPTTTDYRYVIRDIQQPKYNDVSIIVLFTSQADSAGLLAAAMDFRATRFTWIGGSGWSNRVDVTHGNEIIANGSITVNHLGGKVEEFYRYYHRLDSHFENPWSGEFFGRVMKCDISNAPNIYDKNCSSFSFVPNMEMSPVRVVINAVYAFAHALHDMQVITCVGKVGLCEAMKTELGNVKLVEYLRNTSFPDASFNSRLKFNDKQEINGHYSIMNFQQKNGEWDYVNVGEWGEGVNNTFRLDDKLVSWGNAPQQPPTSRCSEPCVFPQIKNPRLSHPQCCWDCVSCQRRQIIVNDSCQSCEQGYRAGANFSSCELVPQEYPNFSGSIAIAYVILTCLCSICAGTTAVFFARHKDHPVVKASGRELSCVILLGILLCYGAVFPMWVKPTALSCSVSRYLGSLCYTFCYAPLLMKTNRIYRIFTGAKKSVARPLMVSPKSQLLVTCGLIFIQLLVTTLWTLSLPPTIKHHYHNDTTTILECLKDNLTLACNLAYNVFLMLLCTLFAFKTRAFPRNFNEAKYIGIMMYLTCSIWIIFLPSLLNTDNAYVKVYIQAGSYLIIGTITLIGLFAPKVYIILFKKGGNAQDIAKNDSSSNKIANGITSTSMVENKRGSSDVKLLRVNRIYSGHVFGSEGEPPKDAGVADTSRCVTSPNARDTIDPSVT